MQMTGRGQDAWEKDPAYQALDREWRRLRWRLKTLRKQLWELWVEEDQENKAGVDDGADLTEWLG
jgi:hypothetical protein